jgi:hypothetical protein
MYILIDDMLITSPSPMSLSSSEAPFVPSGRCYRWTSTVPYWPQHDNAPDTVASAVQTLVGSNPTPLVVVIISGLKATRCYVIVQTQQTSSNFASSHRSLCLQVVLAPSWPIKVTASMMSSEARPISSAEFSRAIEDLPIENLYTKASEIANSISHLERSNKQLQEYSDSIRNDMNIDAATRAEGDKDCSEAIRENEVVIQRQRDRVDLLKQEVERRGGRWHEGELGAKINGFNGTSGENETAPSGRLTDEELRRHMQERMGDEEQSEEGMHL